MNYYPFFHIAYITIKSLNYVLDKVVLINFLRLLIKLTYTFISLNFPCFVIKKIYIFTSLPSPFLFNTNTLARPQFFSQKCSECFYAFLAKIKQLSRMG